jgi:hypothetical protein
VRVQVVAVSQQDVADGIARVDDLRLDARQPPVEKSLEEVPVFRGERPLQLLALHSAGHLRLDGRTERPDHDVVVVITGEEDDSLAPQLALQEVEEAPGLAEGVLHRREEEVEDVPQQDHLVDLVEPGLQPLQRVPVRQE